MFKTGDFSNIAQVSARLLRYYDDIGLFSPAYIDPETGYRYYTVEQLPRLNQILALRDLGLSLEQIHKMLDETITTEEIRGMLRLQKAQIEESISEQSIRLRQVETRLDYLDKHQSLPRHEVIIKPVPAQYIISLREVTPRRNAGKIFYDLFAAVPLQQYKQRGACMAIFYDNEFDSEQLDWEVGFVMHSDTVEQIALADGRWLHLREVPGLDSAASTVFNGRWIGLHQGYSLMGEWIAGHGYRIQNAGREVFHKLFPPDRSEQNVTEIIFPIEKIG
jgi:DNA-binding transcriptional MerR regulator